MWLRCQSSTIKCVIKDGRLLEFGRITALLSFEIRFFPVLLHDEIAQFSFILSSFSRFVCDGINNSQLLKFIVVHDTEIFVRHRAQLR